MLLERCRSRTQLRAKRGRAHEFKPRSGGSSASKSALGTTASKIDSWTTSESANRKLMRRLPQGVDPLQPTSDLVPTGAVLVQYPCCSPCQSSPQGSRVDARSRSVQRLAARWTL